jgi:sulfide:quinone oxidoreductase
VAGRYVGAMLTVVIAGGGVAALESALALRKLAAERVKLTLLTPAQEFVYRPMAVLEPFVEHGPRTLSLDKFAAECDATIVHDTLTAVDRDLQVARTSSGLELGYDSLLIAVGASTSEVLPGAIVIDPAHIAESLSRLLQEIDSGAARNLAFVIPRPAWPLPAYELALLVAERARERGAKLKVSIITAEQRPLGVFGEAVSTDVSALLREAEIELTVESRVTHFEDAVLVNPGQRELRFDHVIAVPRLAGPAIAGLPADAAGFIPVTPRGQVAGVERVYAAGDATEFPVKWGGFAAQQADAAAASIAALAGANVSPQPFEGVVHGLLLGGRDQRRLYFTATITEGSGRDSRTSDTPTASPDAKISAQYLGPYLDDLWAAGPRWLSNQLSWESVLSRLERQAPAAP